MDSQTPHVALLPSPGMGHLIPVIQLAKRLLHRHRISSTIIIPASGPPSHTQTTLLQSLPEPINHILLPIVDLPKNDKSESRISLTVIRSLPYLRGTFDTLLQTTKLAALIVDPFCLCAFDLARGLGIKPYLFFTSGAMTLSFCLQLPQLDRTVACEYRDLTDPIELPGCVPIHGRDLLDPVQDRSNDAYKRILDNVERFAWAEGIILNSFLDLEEGAIRALEMEEPGKPPVYAIGPLVQIQSGSSYESGRLECLKWLDSQPDGSVLFISLGSGGTLSHAQTDELALGLEMSGHKFLWVVRIPSERATAAYFGDQGQNDPLSFLPNGFLENTKGMGLVVPSWAPQIEVLSHGSTGGFLTHCGWNSILESTVHGVPLIAWPLYAEQKMNAAMLTEGVKVALRPKLNENGIVGREEIARVVKDLMEGEEGMKVRLRMQGLKHAGAKALSEDGSSSRSLSSLAFRLMNKQ